VCGVVVLAGIPVGIGKLPASGSTLSAAALRSKILKSASVPYEGYAESIGALGLPQLPDLGDVTTLLDGTTDLYAWYRSPTQWRADDISQTGETDIYQTGDGTYQWDYGRNLLTHVDGPPSVRLPQTADLLPPALGLRLLRLASPADHLSRLPSRRVAGVDAAGLRLVPAGPATTVAEIDIWADPVSGLPVEVQVTGKGSAQPVIFTRFLDLSLRRPSLATVTPHPAPGVGVTLTKPADANSILNGFGPPMPGGLAGLGRVAAPGDLTDVAAYGTGLTQFAVVPLPLRVGVEAISAARSAGAADVTLPGAPAGETAVLIRTPLLTVLLVSSVPVSSVQGRNGQVVIVPRGGRPPRRALAPAEAGRPLEPFGYTFMLAGPVTPALLQQAASDLLHSVGRTP